MGVAAGAASHGTRDAAMSTNPWLARSFLDSGPGAAKNRLRGTQPSHISLTALAAPAATRTPNHRPKHEINDNPSARITPAQT